ncbi:putative FecR-like transmembrane sensor [Methylocaldum marinum]|uniref:Putative FecR-like transmembrane sensor n=1 Tax=Methylocaldum marinum TaxID=1432792 RepID=A0A286P3A3_9GAMM|nr:FecR family protein [Methylocaldum marinum]BBA32125.1 putative FecR-like transmembrane sensor [Methylocaldum marinum]
MTFNGDDDPKPPGTPQADALAWFARLRDSETGAAEREAFAAWRAAKPEHAEAYARVEKLWNSPALSKALARFPAAVPPVVVRTPWRKPRRWAAAASVLLLVGWLAAASGLIDRWRADYTTVAGEQRRIALADGSTVILNTDSALALDFNDDRRGVRLLAGEAYFEVRSDSARPFVVSTGNTTVRVVGTRFSVRTGETTSVAVDSGIVACTNGQGAGVRVTAGQRVSISQKTVTPPEQTDAERAFAWLKGRLIFKDRSLADVLDELDRYHPGIIVMANGKLGDSRVTGNYKLDDTAAVVRALADITGARVITVSPYLTVVR